MRSLKIHTKKLKPKNGRRQYEKVGTNLVKNRYLRIVCEEKMKNHVNRKIHNLSSVN